MIIYLDFNAIFFRAVFSVRSATKHLFTQNLSRDMKKYVVPIQTTCREQRLTLKEEKEKKEEMKVGLRKEMMKRMLENLRIARRG